METIENILTYILLGLGIIAMISINIDAYQNRKEMKKFREEINKEIGGK